MIHIRTHPLGVTVLGSGSAGNAAVVHTPTGGILVDAGFSGRDAKRRLAAAGIEERSIQAILVTHEHTDHVKGVGVLARSWDVPVYANRATAEMLSRKREELPALKIFTAGQSFQVGAFGATPFSIPHDASDPVAFAIHCHDFKVGIATDLGHVSHVISHHLQTCDALVLESNHDVGLLRDCDRPWSLKRRILSRHGHLSNEAGLQLMCNVLHARTQHVVFAHASRECNRYELVEEGVAQRLGEIARADVQAWVARQDTPLQTCWIDEQ